MVYFLLGIQGYIEKVFIMKFPVGFELPGS